MQVNIANPTLQHRKFQYRLPHIDQARTVEIQAGGQAKLAEDLSGSDLESVIAQLQRMGAVPQSEVGSIILPKALIFDVSTTPIKIDRIEEGLERDEDARQDVSAAKMEEAGLGAFAIAENLVKGKSKLVETSVEIIETTDRGQVKGGVNTEYVVSTAANRRAGKKRTEEKS